MTKYWTLIAARRPHIFSLGKLENEDAALAKADDFCKRKNEEVAQAIEEKRIPKENAVEYICLCILDESDMRNLTGEVHRPFVIASPKETVAVEGPKKHGANDDDDETGGASSRFLSADDPRRDG